MPTTINASFDHRDTPASAGAWFRHTVSGRVFYTARPELYTNTRAARRSYTICLRSNGIPITASDFPGFTHDQIIAGLTTPAVES